jgi:hypothetical protein
MARNDEITTVAPQAAPFRLALTYYEMALAVVMMALGLWQWALIVGLASPSFETMPLLLKTATMYFATANLVASVGLWMRVAWGRVLYIIAAVSEVALHTVFIATFGDNWPLVAMHVTLLLIYAGLAVLARRQPAATA